MTLGDVIRWVASGTGITAKKAREVSDAFLGVIRAGVEKEGRVHIPGFGVFYRKRHKARRIVGPDHETNIRLRATETIGFRASKNLRKTLGRAAR